MAFSEYLNFNTQYTGVILNPIPTSQGRNQPLYERHVTKAGRNRVKYKVSMGLRLFRTLEYFTLVVQA